MNSVEKEIAELEKGLRQADLGPDPEYFRKHLDDQMILMIDGKVCFPKDRIVEAHVPGKAPKFDRADISELKIVDQGNAAVVTCIGSYESSAGKLVMNFMRVWVKKPDGWKVVAGSMTHLGGDTSK